ncbi:MAG TPA: hypothetical protein VL551_29220 [Actinospica sp.]|nr:hypothetical protein [Actinospica sp.]
MSLQWRYERLEHAGVLALAGCLEAATVVRFYGALTWPLSRGVGPLILDLSAVEGWDDAGRAAIATAARRLATSARLLELAAAPSGLAGAVIGDPRTPFGSHPDLACALRALGIEDSHREEHRVWQTAGWPVGVPMVRA